MFGDELCRHEGAANNRAQLFFQKSRRVINGAYIPIRNLNCSVFKWTPFILLIGRQKQEELYHRPSPPPDCGDVLSLVNSMSSSLFLWHQLFFLPIHTLRKLVYISQHLPKSWTRSYVILDTWILPVRLVDSILEAVLIVSPQIS